jgi:hypothetical protein
MVNTWVSVVVLIIVTTKNNFEKAEYAGGEGESIFLIFVLYCANKFVSLQAG